MVDNGHDCMDKAECGINIWYPNGGVSKQTGMEVIERLRFLASFGPPSTDERKEGKKMQPFNRFHSHPGTSVVHYRGEGQPAWTHSCIV